MCAEDTAWKSPLKWRLILVAGSICDCPPPVPPPLTPKQGPSDGSRSATLVRFPRRRNAWPRPIVVVVFPSPAGVGVMALTKTSVGGVACALGSSRAAKDILALSVPYWITWFCDIPRNIAKPRYPIWYR